MVLLIPADLTFMKTLSQYFTFLVPGMQTTAGRRDAAS